MDGWTSIFLFTTVATSVTGYFFPFHKLLPSHILGAISLVLLAFRNRRAATSFNSQAPGGGFTPSRPFSPYG